MYGQGILCGISKDTFEIPHKIPYPCIEIESDKTTSIYNVSTRVLKISYLYNVEISKTRRITLPQDPVTMELSSVILLWQGRFPSVLMKIYGCHLSFSFFLWRKIWFCHFNNHVSRKCIEMCWTLHISYARHQPAPLIHTSQKLST